MCRRNQAFLALGFVCLKGTRPVRFRASITTGMRMSCTMMPGMALSSAHGAAGQPQQHRLHHAPHHAAGHHGQQQAAVQSADALPAGPAVQQAHHQAVGQQLKGHRGGGGEQGRHPEQNRAHQGHDEAHRRAVLPAADQPAEEHGDVHGQQHTADLGDLPGEKGQHQAQRQEQGGEGHVFQVLGHTFLLHTDTKWMPDCDSLTLCQLLYNKKAELASPLARSACLVYRPFMANQASAYPARWEISCLISSPVVLMHRW